jgi:hypothetical protein
LKMLGFKVYLEKISLENHFIVAHWQFQITNIYDSGSIQVNWLVDTFKLEDFYGQNKNNNKEISLIWDEQFWKYVWCHKYLLNIDWRMCDVTTCTMCDSYFQKYHCYFKLISSWLFMLCPI